MPQCRSFGGAGLALAQRLDPVADDSRDGQDGVAAFPDEKPDKLMRAIKCPFDFGCIVGVSGSRGLWRVPAMNVQLQYCP